MGQLLVVSGADPERVADVSDVCVRLFDTTSSIRPCSRLASPYLRVVKFPKLCGSTTDIVRPPEDEGWACGAGCWIHTESKHQDTLRTLSDLTGDAADIDRALRAFEGTYCLAFGRGADGAALIATDRIGSLHTYITQYDSCTVACTSSLVLAALIQPGWDLRSCHEFLSTGTVFEQRTLFAKIHKLPPATCIQLKRGRETRRWTYWRLADALGTAERSGRESVSELADSLHHDISRIYGSYPQPVLDLTAGYDSRILCGAALTAVSRKRLATVVVGDDTDADVKVARRVSTHFSINHSHRMLPSDWQRQWWYNAKASLSLCDGEYDVLEYAAILHIHKGLARDYDVSINGSAGEVCRGYWWELLLPLIGARGSFNARRVAASRFAVDRWADPLLRHPVQPSLTDHFTRVIQRANSGIERTRNTAKMDNIYLALRMQRWQGRIASATNRIWSCLSPFMFSKPLELALATHPRTRLGNQMACHLIEHFDRELAAIPLAGGYPALPLRPRTLHRFWPLGRELVGRAGRRLLRSATGGTRQVSPPRHQPTPLSVETEILDLLRPSTMLTQELYSGIQLEQALSPSSALFFSNTRHLGRILTLELLARTVRERSALG